MLTRKIISSGLKSHQKARIIQRHCCLINSSSDAHNTDNVPQQDEFTPLELYSQERRNVRKPRKALNNKDPLPPRSTSMKTDQSWPDVWPAARTFHPGTVPLPVRMGYPATNQPTPDKWANTELMKIPNFLHLTPPAIQRHCAAIRKYCTPWPAGLSYPSTLLAESSSADAEGQHRRPKSLKKVRAKDPSPEDAASDPGYFPMLVTKSSYLFSGPSVTDARARTATVKVRLGDLRLTRESLSKLLRLVGERYDRESDTLTIVADRCPRYQQNLDYCHYLLTVIAHEAQSSEPWEHELERCDHAEFVYEGSSCQAAVKLLQDKQSQDGTVTVGGEQQLAQSLDALLNEGETDESVSDYSESVLALLGITERHHDRLTTHNTTLLHDADNSLPPITVFSYNERNNIVWNSHSRFKGYKPPF